MSLINSRYLKVILIPGRAQVTHVTSNQSNLSKLPCNMICSMLLGQSQTMVSWAGMQTRRVQDFQLALTSFILTPNASAKLIWGSFMKVLLAVELPSRQDHSLRSPSSYISKTWQREGRFPPVLKQCKLPQVKTKEDISRLKISHPLYNRSLTGHKKSLGMQWWHYELWHCDS